MDYTLYRTVQLVTLLLNPQISAFVHAKSHPQPSYHSTCSIISMAARINFKRRSGNSYAHVTCIQVCVYKLCVYVGHVGRQTHLSSLDLFLSESFQRLKQSNRDCTQLEKKQRKSGRVVTIKCSLIPRPPADCLGVSLFLVHILISMAMRQNLV